MRTKAIRDERPHDPVGKNLRTERDPEEKESKMTTPGKGRRKGGDMQLVPTPDRFRNMGG